MNWLFSKQESLRLKPAVFFHIQKTAGSSFVELARSLYGSSVISHGDAWVRRSEVLSNVQFISGHFGYDFARSLLPGRITFTFLRDPVERIISFYSFCRNRDPREFDIYRIASELSFGQFLEAGFTNDLVREFIWNNQVWQMAHGINRFSHTTIDDFGEDELLELAVSNVSTLTKIGFTDTFDHDARHVLQLLGVWDIPDIPKSNRTKHKITCRSISDWEKSLLLELTSLDRKLFDHCKTLYSEKIGKDWTLHDKAYSSQDS